MSITFAGGKVLSCEILEVFSDAVVVKFGGGDSTIVSFSQILFAILR